MVNKCRSSLGRRVPEAGKPAEVFVKGWRSSDTLQRSKGWRSSDTLQRSKSMHLQMRVSMVALFTLLLYACGSTVQEDYYPSGKLRAKVTVDQHAVANGTTSIYYESGVVEAEGFVRNGERDGEWRWYDSTGSLVEIGFYVEGAMHGDFTEYYSSGKVKLKVPYLVGNMHGVAKSYYPTGALESAIQYEVGIQQDTSTYYYPNGTVSMLCEVRNDTILKYTEFDSTGRWMKEFVYYPPQQHPQ